MDYLVYKNFLAHHGIDGQKWGVRNGPPYPLDRETHQKVVRSGYVRDRKKLHEGKLSEVKISKSAHYLDNLDRTWRDVIVASDLKEPTNVAELLSDNPDFKRQGETGWKGIMNAKSTVNIGYKQSDPGTQNNCMKCTAALEMARRGYTLQAGHSFDGGQNAAASYWWDGAVQYKEKSEDAFVSRIAKVLGNNGSGEVQMRYPNGGGHSMYCYMNKGVFNVVDGQTGESFHSYANYHGEDSVKKVLDDVVNKYGFELSDNWSTVTRLDTCTPNFKHMEEDNVLRVNYTNDRMNQIQERETGKFGNMYDTRRESSTASQRQTILSRDSRRREGDYGYYYQDSPTEWGYRYK